MLILCFAAHPTGRPASSPTRAVAPRAALRFTFLRLRGSEGKHPSDGVQLAEVMLYSGSMRLLRSRSAVNPGGTCPHRRQEAASVIDGMLSTKWVDTAMGTSANKSVLVLHFDTAEQGNRPDPSSLDPSNLQYELFTANDNPRRDPVSWCRAQSSQRTPSPP